MALMITGRSIISRFRLRWSSPTSRRRLVVTATLAVSVLSLGWYARSHRWRVWKPGEVQIAFWAWHSDAPGDDDVLRAANQAQAKVLFLRAGQIDFAEGKLHRIRAIAGRFPTSIDIHLVYNATRSCLAEFEKLDARELASVVSESFDADTRRAARDGARLRGAQLDFDVPTRLLPSYTRLLRGVRENLAPESKLSITGLSTWMESGALNDTLAQVDFWIPQCYGATIPETLGQSQSQPITSLKLVSAPIANARRLNRPFYAGLAAHGYAIQYAPNGSLIALRGDLDPALVANDANFELISRGPFEQSGSTAFNGGWRYAYRARNDGVIDGTAVHAFDYLVLDIPTSASLREAARVAREQGGDHLLGICVFRLPRRDDPTSLTIKEVACALAGEEPTSTFHIETRLEQERDAETGGASRARLLIINDGSANSLLDSGAMSLYLKVPDSAVRRLSFHGFASAEPQREDEEPGYSRDANVLRPCSLRRANVLAFAAKAWRPGHQASALIEFAGDPPEELQASFVVNLDDGRVVREHRTMKLRGRTWL